MPDAIPAPDLNATAAAAKDSSVIAPNAQSPGGQAAPLAAHPPAATGPDPEAQRLLAVARRERGLHQQREEFKRQRAETEARLKAAQDALDRERAEIADFRSLREQARKSPLDAMKALGHTYESITEAQLNGGSVSPEKLVALESERLQSAQEKALAERDAKLKELEDRQKQFVEQQQRDYTAAQDRQLADFKANVAGYIRSKASDYEYLAVNDAFDKVADLIVQHHQQSWEADVEQAKLEGRQPNGKTLSAEEAAGMLEKWYEERAEKLAATKKFQAKYKAIDVIPAPAAGAAAPGTQPAANGATDPAKTQVSFETKRGGVTFERTIPGQRPTLSNAASSAPSPVSTQGQPLNEKERMERAIARYDAVEAERRARLAMA